MTRKNKLYKHHKSKSYFYIKDFSFAIAALIGIGTAIAVPTYIVQTTKNKSTINLAEEKSSEIENENSEEIVSYESYND